jgi:hypothetical protein
VAVVVLPAVVEAAEAVVGGERADAFGRHGYYRPQ